MMRAKAIGWVRDSKGKVVRHTYKDVCNCLTTFCGGAYRSSDGNGEHNTICTNIL